VIASAQAVERQAAVWPILLAASAAALLADTQWYLAARRHGARMRRLICRVSLSPDSCVASTRAIYAKWGPPSLMLAKFIPGFAAVGTALAGHQRTPLGRFAIFDGIGALLWAGAAIALGVVFHDAVHQALLRLESLGRVGVGLVLAALLAFNARKAWKRRVFLHKLRMERISVPELHALMEAPAEPLVVDVRSEAERAATGWIPGAVHATRVPELASHVHGEVVVYCDCPNEASAAPSGPRAGTAYGTPRFTVVAADGASCRPRPHAKRLYEKVDERAHLRRQVLARWEDRVDAEFDRPELRQDLDQGARGQVRRHQERGLQHDALVLQCRGAAGVAAVGTHAWRHLYGDGPGGPFELPLLTHRQQRIGNHRVSREVRRMRGRAVPPQVLR